MGGAEGEDPAAAVDELADGALRLPDPRLEVGGAVALGAGAEGRHGMRGMLAAHRRGAAPEGVGDGAVGGRRRHLVVDLGGAVVEGGHEQRPLGPHRLQQGRDDRVGAALDMPDLRQRAVDHEVHAALDAEAAQVGDDPRLADHLAALRQVDVVDLGVGLEEPDHVLGPDLAAPRGGPGRQQAPPLPGQGGGDLGEGAAAVGPVQRPGALAGAGDLAGHRRRQVLGGRREQGLAPRDASQGRGGADRRSAAADAGGGLPHLAAHPAQLGHHLAAVAAPEPALQPRQAGLVGAAQELGAVAVEAAAVGAHLPGEAVGLGAGDLHDFRRGGVGQVVEVGGHGGGAGLEPRRAQQLELVRRGVVGVPGAAVALVVVGDPRTGVAVLGIADEGVAGGHEGTEGEVVTGGPVLAQGGAQDLRPDPVDEAGRARHRRPPLEAAVADPRPRAEGVDADPGQGRLQPLHPLQVGEEPVALVAVDQADRPPRPRQRPGGDESLQDPGDLDGDGAARGVVHGPRLGGVGDGPDLVLRVAAAGDHPADDVVGAHVAPGVDADLHHEAPMLPKLPPEAVPLAARYHQPHQLRRGVVHGHGAPAELDPGHGAGVVGHLLLHDHRRRPLLGEPLHAAADVEAREHRPPLEPIGPHAVEGFLIIDYHQLAAQPAFGRSRRPLHRVPGVVAVVGDALAERPHHVEGGGADVLGLLDDPAPGADAAAGLHRGHLGAGPRLLVHLDEDPRGVVEAVEGVPAVVADDLLHHLHHALAVAGAEDGGQGAAAEPAQGGGGGDRHRMAIGRPGDPVPPLKGIGAKTKRNSWTSSSTRPS